jgi:hypothetical protein
LNVGITLLITETKGTSAGHTAAAATKEEFPSIRLSTQIRHIFQVLSEGTYIYSVSYYNNRMLSSISLDTLL